MYIIVSHLLSLVLDFLLYADCTHTSLHLFLGGQRRRFIRNSSYTDHPLVDGGPRGWAAPQRRVLPWLQLQLPPLRARPEDIPLLTHTLLQRAADRLGVRVTPTLAPEVEAQLLGYDWPGNIRELKRTMESALFRALSHGGARDLQLQDLEGFLGGTASDRVAPAASGPLGWEGDGTSIPALATMERWQIMRALEATGWHQGRAATQLGISAKTLYRKIRELQFTRPHARGAIPVRSRASCRTS